jgi:hypothetical protein
MKLIGYQLNGECIELDSLSIKGDLECSPDSWSGEISICNTDSGQKHTIPKVLNVSWEYAQEINHRISKLDEKMLGCPPEEYDDLMFTRNCLSFLGDLLRFMRG